MEMYFHHPMCDLGDVSKNTTDPKEWQTEKKTIQEHLDYKFILALEGNDVASGILNRRNPVLFQYNDNWESMYLP